MIKQVIENNYFLTFNWYILAFIISITYTINNYYVLRSYYNFLLIIALIVLAYLSNKKHIIINSLSKIIILFLYGILIVQYKQHVTNHDIIKKSENVYIEGKIRSLTPYYNGIQAIINLEKITPNILKTDSLVRINFSKSDMEEYLIGDKIGFDAFIGKPPEKIIPYGYDFSFYAYYAGLSAVGKKTNREIILINQEKKIYNYIQNLRRYISKRLIKNLGQENGSFAAAILLGEGKGIKQNILNNLRYAGISHVICVSGLHLGLVSIIIYKFFRIILNMSNIIAYSINIKTLSSIITLIGSYIYLLLSGNQVAANRAFIMTSLVFISIIIKRNTDITRTISIAAFIILSFNPELILHPSFQLSFVAVLSLVYFYGYYIKHQDKLTSYFKKLSYIKQIILSNLYTSLIATAATTPVVIYHFYIFSTYSIITNLIVLPIISFAIMPLILINLLIIPFGLDVYISRIIGFFISIVIKTASYIVKLNKSLLYCGYIKPYNLILYLIGFFLLCYTKNKKPILPIIIIFISIILMFNNQKPDMIINIKKNIIAIKNKDESLSIYYKRKNLFIEDYWANWYGTNKYTDYKYDLKEKNFFYITKERKKIFVISSNKYQCLESDLTLNYFNNQVCNNAKKNVTKQYLKNKESIVIYCNKDSCTIKH